MQKLIALTVLLSVLSLTSYSQTQKPNINDSSRSAKILPDETDSVDLVLETSVSKLPNNTINLTDENTVFLKDMVRDESMTRVMQEISKREDNSEPVIYLVLDTPGGYVDSGLNLIHFLKGFKKPVKTITVFAASMGFQIAQGNPGDRLILDVGVLMSHPMAGGMGGQFGAGMSMENRTKYINETIVTMDKQVVERAKGKQTLEGYVKAYDNELWTTGANAVDLGYADSVTQVSCSSGLTADTELVDEREYIGGSYAINVKYEFSKCPLMMSILKYQISITDLLREKTYILDNKGYEIPKPEKKENPFPFLFGEQQTPPEVDKIAAQSKQYRVFKMLLDRKLMKTEKLDWLYR